FDVILRQRLCPMPTCIKQTNPNLNQAKLVNEIAVSEKGLSGSGNPQIIKWVKSAISDPGKPTRTR
ncbi:1597_t:CDS:1, partial [Gigaspora rosea]